MSKRANSRHTKRLAGAAACAAALPLMMSAFSGAGATIGDPGDDPKVVLPPACTAGDVRWNATGTPASIMATYGMSGTGVTERTIPGMKVPAGTVTVVQVVGYDAYEDRATAEPQGFEQVRLSFYKDGNLVTSSYASDDLRDNVTSAWWVGGLGTFELPNGADEVRVQHAAKFDGVAGDNGLAAAGVCLQTTAYAPELSATIANDCKQITVTVTNKGTAEGEAVIRIDAATDTVKVAAGDSITKTYGVEEDRTYNVTVAVDGKRLAEKIVGVDCVPATTPPTTTPPTTTPPTTTPPTTAPPTTVAPATTAPAVQVLGQQVTRQPDTEVLAYTGKRSVFQAIGGGLLLLGGLHLVRSSRRRIENI